MKCGLIKNQTNQLVKFQPEKSIETSANFEHKLDDFISKNYALESELTIAVSSSCQGRVCTIRNDSLTVN